MTTDVVVAGGGIVGLASAWRILQAHPGLRLTLLEKEARVAAHQTGRNSGVMHSGIYYQPGSGRARLCRRGHAQLVAFAREFGVAHDVCGKLIVATREDELPGLEGLLARAAENGLQGVRRMAPEQIRQIEPYAAGIAGLHVPETGIIDFPAVCERLVERIRALGGDVRLDQPVSRLETRPDGKMVRTRSEEYHCAAFINCTGLMSDRVARLDGLDPEVSIVPFRGEYFELVPESRHLVRHLIYPVPDPALPFLGVHLTRMVGGAIECGPNAVLAFKREGYRKRDVSLTDVREMLANPGLRALIARHWRYAAREFQRSISRAAFTRALQRLVPAIEQRMLVPAEAGVRAMAIRRDGSMVDDFLFVTGERSLHVLNAPSPAATASLAIGEEIAARYAALGG